MIDEIKNKCENLDINTIPDVGVGKNFKTMTT